MPPEFDLTTAHKYFAAHCFNSAWDLIDKTDRTPEEDETMIALNQASIFHWRNRPDCADKNLSIGYWQASRIRAILGHAEEAKRCAKICLGYSKLLEPFYLGYAYEALARAASIAGESETAKSFADLAYKQANLVKDAQNCKSLLNDLKTIKS
jgi:hypothetical protein